MLQSSNLRPSQIACTVTTVHVTCLQTALNMHKDLCILLIPLCKSNFNLLMCSSFSAAPCLVASSCCSSCCHACYFSALHWFFCFFIFTENDFVAQPKTRLSLSQSKGWFPFILLCLQMGKISLNRSAGFMCELYQQDFRITLTYVFIEILSQCDKC